MRSIEKTAEQPEHDGNDGFEGTESNINTNDPPAPKPPPSTNFGNRRVNETQMCFINVPQMSLYFHQQTIMPSVVFFFFFMVSARRETAAYPLICDTIWRADQITCFPTNED